MADTIEQRFTYDWYEFEMGDGFFPEPVECGGDTVINFRKEGYYWVQSSGDAIAGLDGDFGIKTLNALNKKYKTDELQVTTKMCMTRMKKQGITERVLSTPLNELSKEEFVFRVVDEMVNCEWKAQAEYIISLVGPERKPACRGIKNMFGRTIYPNTQLCKLT